MEAVDGYLGQLDGSFNGWSCCAEWVTLRKHAKILLGTTKFDIFMACVILANAFLIGVQQTLEIRGDDTTIAVYVENLFLLIYITELWLRVFVNGAAALKDHWVKFDVIIVALGILTNFLLEPLMSQSDSLGFLMLFRLLRLTRLLRLGKMARFIATMPTFRMIVRGVSKSGSLLITFLLILFAIVYIQSCIAIELITKNKLNVGEDADPAFQEHVDDYFASLPMTMVTLVQFVCLDNMHDIYKPLIQKDPTLGIFFISVILSLSIVVMNLLGAVVVIVLMETNQREKDDVKDFETQRYLRLQASLHKVCGRLEVDSAEILTVPEYNKIGDAEKLGIIRGLGLEKPEDLFKHLLVGHTDAEVTVDDFMESCFREITNTATFDSGEVLAVINALHDKLKLRAAHANLKEYVGYVGSCVTNAICEISLGNYGSSRQASQHNPAPAAKATLEKRNTTKTTREKSLRLNSPRPASMVSDSVLAIKARSTMTESTARGQSHQQAPSYGNELKSDLNQGGSINLLDATQTENDRSTFAGNVEPAMKGKLDNHAKFRMANKDNPLRGQQSEYSAEVPRNEGRGLCYERSEGMPTNGSITQSLCMQSSAIAGRQAHSAGGFFAETPKPAKAAAKSQMAFGGTAKASAPVVLTPKGDRPKDGRPRTPAGDAPPLTPLQKDLKVGLVPNPSVSKVGIDIRQCDAAGSYSGSGSTL